ncbi:MAG: isoprenylcysteine carboxylmethyltransferase family protein [Bacteroidota bacterium]|nr:isoprenylcysteine carboxylmethyltransferase family protein [Bacteroidota bacterium]
MSLIYDFEKQGSFLFKYRGQFPVLLFLLAIPFIYFTDYNKTDFYYIELLRIIALFLCVVGFLVRFYTIGTTPKGTSGRNRKKQIADVLNSEGMYSIVRHPLYFGNYLIWFGLSVFTYNFYFMFIITLLFWLYYERIMFVEERFLERKFGDIFRQWAKNSPAFIPNFLSFKKSQINFSIITVLRREYAGLFSTVIGFMFIEIVRNYCIYETFKLNLTMTYIFLVSVLLVLLLRSLKHYTKLLNEDERS